ncbi:MAG TPA: outer membrane beta-barrel protein [Chthoniobacterales bacterium]|nr:outer membrane beta-barrel protein [Chthoniobacterales bacterium]HXY60792.1 outer membrane beta-barrel protein [Chthoniobacterales bacterium]
MKQTAALSFALLFTLCALTFAGSEPLPAKEMPVVPPACHDWTGFYIGGFGAYTFNTVDVNLGLGGEWGATPDERGVVQSEGEHDLDHSGGELGGLIGYNWMYRKCWVFGLEADGGYLWARKSRDTGIFEPGDEFFPEHIETSFKTHYLTTVGFRVGHAWGNLLPYVTGGLAIGDSDFSQMIINVPPNFKQGGSKTNTDVGGFVGAGLQYAFADHWSVRGQYEFVDLGSFVIHHETTESTFVGTSSPQLHEHNLSVAVIFQF